PRGVAADPTADLTLFYANNTIYGSTMVDFPQWNRRPGHLVVTLLNGDHFVHGYQAVDFGGMRGWENQFQGASAPPDMTNGGFSSGCQFTFGRAHWWPIAGGPWGLIDVPPVQGGSNVGRQRLELTLNFESSRRLRLYQFDPYHHDVAVYSTDPIGF